MEPRRKYRKRDVETSNGGNPHRSNRALSRAEADEIKRQIEGLLINLVSTRDVVRAVCQRYPHVTAHSAQRLVNQVWNHWQEEGERVGAHVEERERLMRRTGQLFRQATTRKRILRDKSGKALLDDSGQPLSVVDPDMWASVKLIELRAKLAGIYAANVTLSADHSLAGLLALAAQATEPEQAQDALRDDAALMVELDDDERTDDEQ